MVAGQHIITIKTAGVSWCILRSKHVRGKHRWEHQRGAGTAVTVLARVGEEPVHIMVESVAGCEICGCRSNSLKVRPVFHFLQQGFYPVKMIGINRFVIEGIHHFFALVPQADRNYFLLSFSNGLFHLTGLRYIQLMERSASGVSKTDGRAIWECATPSDPDSGKSRVAFPVSLWMRSCEKAVFSFSEEG